MSDAIVVGAGLAGLTAALRLAEGGRRVTVIARGVGGLPLSSGTVDVLGYGPERIDRPREALPGFAAARPTHPYAILAPALEEALGWFRDQVPDLGYVGDLERNLLLPTAVGVAKPAALAPAGMAGGDLSTGGRLLFVGFRALKDLYPRLAAANVARAALPNGGVSARAVELLASPRPGDADVGALHFARAFDAGRLVGEVADELGPLVEPGERIGLPALLGIDRHREVWSELQERLGAPVFEIPLLPPSVPGMRVYRALTRALRRAGGRMLVGPEAVGGETNDGRVAALVVQESGRRRRHEAADVVLATGGLAAGGIEIDSRGELRETLLDLPVSAPDASGARVSGRYLDPQPLLAAGLAVDADLRPVDGGGRAVHPNVRAVGAMLAGAEPWREKSGEGIAIASGFAAAYRILEGS